MSNNTESQALGPQSSQTPAAPVGFFDASTLNANEEIERVLELGKNVKAGQDGVEISASDILRNKSNSIDCYRVLRFDPAEKSSVTQEDIKRNYRKLAMMLHPDKNRSAGAEEAFKIVNLAYSVLSDPDRRSTYDTFGTTDMETVPFIFRPINVTKKYGLIVHHVLKALVFLLHIGLLLILAVVAFVRHAIDTDQWKGDLLTGVASALAFRYLWGCWGFFCLRHFYQSAFAGFFVGALVWQFKRLMLELFLVACRRAVEPNKKAPLIAGAVVGALFWLFKASSEVMTPRWNFVLGFACGVVLYAVRDLFYASLGVSVVVLTQLNIGPLKMTLANAVVCLVFFWLLLGWSWKWTLLCFGLGLVYTLLVVLAKIGIEELAKEAQEQEEQQKEDEGDNKDQQNDEVSKEDPREASQQQQQQQQQQQPEEEEEYDDERTNPTKDSTVASKRAT